MRKLKKIVNISTEKKLNNKNLILMLPKVTYVT